MYNFILLILMAKVNKGSPLSNSLNYVMPQTVLIVLRVFNFNGL